MDIRMDMDRVQIIIYLTEQTRISHYPHPWISIYILTWGIFVPDEVVDKAHKLEKIFVVV